MFPNADRAFVEPAKVRDYLLSPVHPVGRFKAAVFGALGYTAATWEQLRDDLLHLAVHGVAVAGRASPYGQKYEVSGTLKGPNSREAQIVSVWLLPADGGAPRFVTAFPG